MLYPNQRISRVHGSWRVRVPGRSAFFADSKYGSTAGALRAAREWRDRHWDGKSRGVKLTPAERRRVARSTGDYRAVAERYGISPGYVHYLRRESRG